MQENKFECSQTLIQRRSLWWKIEILTNREVLCTDLRGYIAVQKAVRQIAPTVSSTEN
jgi:hypothetical protein